jgi:hypothetical protein
MPTLERSKLYQGCLVPPTPTFQNPPSENSDFRWKWHGAADSDPPMPMECRWVIVERFSLAWHGQGGSESAPPCAYEVPVSGWRSAYHWLGMDRADRSPPLLVSMECRWVIAERFSLAWHGHGGSESAPPCAHGVPMGDGGALFIGLAWTGRIGVRPSLCPWSADG